MSKTRPFASALALGTSLVLSGQNLADDPRWELTAGVGY